MKGLIILSILVTSNFAFALGGLQLPEPTIPPETRGHMDDNTGTLANYAPGIKIPQPSVPPSVDNQDSVEIIKAKYLTTDGEIKSQFIGTEDEAIAEAAQSL